MHTFLLRKTPQLVLSILALSVCVGVCVPRGNAAPPFQSNPSINWPRGASYNGPVNPFAAAGFGNQCTSFAWGRAHEVTGVSLPFRGHAKTWYASQSYPKGSEARANSIAVWEGDKPGVDKGNPYGHVAYVESVSGNDVYFSEANILTSRSNGGYDGSIKRRTKSELKDRGQGVGKLLGYIYFAANAQRPAASLKTVSPNGGERWTIGTTQTVRWTYTGDASSIGGGVRIEILRGNTVSYTVPASIIIGRNGSGSFNWRVPRLPVDANYKVRVVSSMNVSDLSDRPFTIVGASVRTATQEQSAAAPKPEKKGSALVKWFEEEDDSKRIPLILIHGIHGSQDLSEITKKGVYWRNFLTKFNSELKETYSLYAFQYYSDQEGVQDLAKQLGKSIDARLADRPHVLLAHSMGGLVAKSYMVDYRHEQGAWSGKKGGDSTLLLITLATPHHGTPGANDADAIEQYMGRGWHSIFSTLNFVYWTKEAGFRSPPTKSSDAYNRSDLRWDNYDNAITTDLNSWLGAANRDFKGYSSKVIAYAGALKFSKMTAAGAYAKLPLLVRYNNHQLLGFLNDTMVSGLDSRFGITDGMVPYNSAVLCDPGPFIGPPSTTFLCLSPTRVRRFEPGKSETLELDNQTLSITRQPRGYDHLDMLDHEDVLSWVVKDLSIGPKPLVSTSLQLSPNSAYQVGQSINGTFTITNRGKSDLYMNRVVIGGRLAGICPNNKCPDFGPAPGNVTLRPNESYSYSGSFTPAQAGNYTFSVAYENAEGRWTMPVEAENNNKNQLNVAVTSVQPNVVVSRSLTIAQGGGPFPVGQAISGSFSITNRGNAPLTMRQVVIGGRVGDNCPNNVCPDFSPVNPDVTLNPGQTFSYSGQFSLNRPGSYTFYVAYQMPDGKWEMPVKPEAGAVNRVSVLVQPPGPVVNRVSPASTVAHGSPQVINLYGVRLAKVLYAQLRLPNGKITYLYLPLNQVFRVNDEEMRISAKFEGRGTYYVTVWTADGKSNEFPIVVH